MDLSIIIVNYNVKYFLEQCLYSVKKAVKNIDAEIFVIDNASSDGSREYFEKRFTSVHFKWNTENVGFAKANNSVLQEVKGKYILFLNPDTLIPEDCLERCLSFAAGQEDFGGLGIRMVDGSGEFLRESKRSFPSASASFFKMSGITALFPHSKLFARYYAGHLHNTKSHEIDVLAGAFMMISRKALEKTAGFDEDFFMYGEDIDLSYRIHKAGLKNYYFADSTIIHFKGESTSKTSAKYIRNFYGAMGLFVKKHVVNKKKAAFMRMGIFAARSIAVSKQLFRKKEKIKAAGLDTNTAAIVSSQSKFNEIIHIVKYSKKPLMIKGRVTVSPRDPESSIGKLADISQLIKRKMFNHLIFSESDISFKDMIEQVQKFKKKIFFLFHAKGSKSIVGSSKKNVNGFFIAGE